MIEMEWNGALKEEKRRPKQRVIAGLLVNVATAMLALTRDAIPCDSLADNNKRSLYDREST